MEEEIGFAPEKTGEEPLTRAEVERQLGDLAQRLTQRIEAGNQAENARREELDTREDALHKRELAARAREALEKRGLPAALAETLSFPGEDALENGVNALEEGFRAAVQRAVEERLLTDAPKASSLKPLSELSDEDYYAAVCRRD